MAVRIPWSQIPSPIVEWVSKNKFLRETGISESQIAEAFLLASVEGTGTQLYWAREVYEAPLICE